MYNQNQFIKRLERAEAAVRMLERKRAFFSAPEQKIDLDRLGRAEMSFLSYYLRNTGFIPSELTLLDKDTLDEIYEKAAGIRDCFSIAITTGTNARGCRYCKIQRRPDAGPWELHTVHGRYLPQLESAVLNHPYFQSDLKRSRFSDDLALKQLRAMEAEMRARKKGK